MPVLFKRPNHFENIKITSLGSSVLYGTIRNQVAHISSLVVDRSHLRKGIGTQLFECFEQQAINENVENIVIEVYKHNKRGLDFWSRQGFSITGDADEYYVEMVKDLTQEITNDD